MKSWSLFSRHATAGLLSLGCILSAALPAMLHADAPAFYRGDTITLVVGYGAGGGYDTYARLLAPWIEKRTGATVVVENRPGGGGLVAINQVYDAKADGRTLMLVNGNAAAMAQLLGIEGVRFDLLDMPILGRVSAEPSVVMLSARSRFASIDDLVRDDGPVKWSAGGKTDSIGDSAACFSEALGLSSRIIIGYKGAKESGLAAMRGEVDGVVTSAGTAGKLSAGGELIPVAVLDRDRSALMPDLPTVFEAVELDDAGAWWMDFWANIARIGRILVITPETPAERVDYLREVISGILADPAFVGEAEKSRRPIRFLDAPAVESLFSSTLGGITAEEIERVKTVVLDKYYR